MLCASNTIYAIDKSGSTTEPPTFTANTTPIHTLLAASDSDHFLSAAETDRFINIFSLSESKHTGALVAESDVLQVSVFTGNIDTTLVSEEDPVALFKVGLVSHLFCCNTIPYRLY